MPAPRPGDLLCPTGAVVMRGRRGVIERHGLRSTWTEGTCTWCGKPVPPGRRRTWCSQWCVDAYRSTQPEHQRTLVEERDRGVCALCGLDTPRLRQACLRYYGSITILMRRSSRHRRSDRITRLAEILTARGLESTVDHVAHLLFQRACWWDMDHQIPIAEGGHPFDLRNLRTLCWWCHKDETAQGATRRAERRRGVADVSVEQVGLFDRDFGVESC